jgi:hypothetical protein
MALLLVTKTVHNTRIGRTENVEVTSLSLDTVTTRVYSNYWDDML